MSKLEELVQQLCPDGVKYVELENICQVSKGVQFNKKDMKDEGSYPVINGGINPSGYIEKYNQIENTITISQGGASAGYVNWLKTKFWAGAHCYVLKPTDMVINRYLYHFVKSKEYKLQECQYGAGIPALAKSTVTALKIPLPPISVQREIIRILDNFTELTDELTTELTARKKQYEYYRNQMMSFDCSVPIKRIGEITNVFSAARVHKNEWTSEGVPFYRSSDVISLFNGVPNSRGKAFISYELYNKLSKKSGIIKKGDVLVTGGGTIGIPFVVPTDDPIYVKDADLICIQRSDAFESKYLYHYFLTTKFKDYLSNITHNATIAHYTISQILDTPIPLPSLEEQRRIVSILDRFDALCNDLTSGLPAEIAARQKQYEYYRDKLLTFNKERLF